MYCLIEELRDGILEGKDKKQIKKDILSRRSMPITTCTSTVACFGVELEHHHVLVPHRYICMELRKTIQ